MSTISTPRQTRSVPPLENGDCLDQPTFHQRYEAMPEVFRAELIGGTVFIPSPQGLPHSRAHTLLIRWLDEYIEATPGTDALPSVTLILGPESEPQPDACFFLTPEYGDSVYVNQDEYLCGVPELIVEVCPSTESIDLHAKKRDYEKAGVREYVVLTLRKQQIFWFARQRGKYKEVPVPTDGIFRSRVFPGLWLAADAMLRYQRQPVLAALRQGLASAEHAAFVSRLAKRAAQP